MTSALFRRALGVGLLLLSFGGAAGAAPVPDAASQRISLPPLPDNLPSWIRNKRTNHLFYQRGAYNFDVYNLKSLAYDLNAVAVGHAMAYEDLVTGRASRLETATYDLINHVLNHPPRLMPDEAAISPTFTRRFGVLEQVFDWTHVLHAQTIDVLASRALTQPQKEQEIEKLWDFYFKSVPYAITPLPMNMGWLDSQPYSAQFRRRYPKVNGLFWGYHWLQGSMYDTLWKKSPRGQEMSWDLIGNRYHQVELQRTDRPFMPMFAEVSPNFAARFPHIANAFDNLHMLHDLVNDILATPGLTSKQQDDQVTRAIWLVSAQAHAGEKPGEVSSPGSWHDHRFFEGMPGMGLMTGMPPELMWVSGEGWMNMGDCHHCSMALNDATASSVSAQGWSMRVRCPLCARDMSAETKGRALLNLASEDPSRIITVVSDESGNLSTDTPEAVFLEDVSSHVKCNQWSQAFTSRGAFDQWIKSNPKFAGSKPLTFQDWSTREAAATPDTYIPETGPSSNPFAGKAGGAP